VKAAAAERGRALPFGIGADGSAQVGGILATNAGGHMALRSGVARDLVLGLEAVLPDGTLLPGPSPLRKDNTGFDVARLLIGAEGWLGIITATALRLVPLPVVSATALVAFPEVDAAMRLLVRLKERTGYRLAAFELMMPAALQLAFRHVPAARGAIGGGHGAYALVELDDVVPGPALRELAEALLGEALEDGTAEDVVIAESLERRAALWALRESFPEAQGKEGLSLKHDIALPLPELAPFIRRAEAEMTARFPVLTPIVYGHAGDGNLHWNLQAATRELPDQMTVAEESRQALYDIV
jgi:D-lactate dehydrogenase (cytochrome)